MSETVAPEKVVSFHYKLTTNEGKVIDTSDEGEPLAYLHGADNIVPGLEKAMTDRQAGEEFDVQVPASEGYGERVEGSAVVPRSEFPSDVELQPGMRLVAEGPDGVAFPLWIAKVAGDEVTVDPNHPLAGMDLNFEVKIEGVRPATPEEIENGHPHDADGAEAD